MLIFASDLQAQILNRLQRRAQERVEERIEQRIERELFNAADKMVDKTWESIFGADPERSDDVSSRILPFSLNSDVATESAYHFNTISIVEIISTKADGASGKPVEMHMHFSDNGQYTGTTFSGEEIDTGEGNMFMIYDFTNGAMIMLMESEEGKFSFAYDWTSIHAEDSESDVVDTDYVPPSFTHIGSRTIAGYNAEGYRLEEDGIRTDIWVTDTETFGTGHFLTAYSSTAQMSGVLPGEYPSGTILEIHSENLSNGEKVVIRTKDVKKNVAVVYKMDDYPNISSAMAEEN
jgi:hypothetical protein